MARNRIRLAAAGLTLVAGGVAAGTLMVSGSSAATDDPEAPGEGTSQDARPEPHEHTDVTGGELARVTEAVEAHDASITVGSVRKDPDGSYDVAGTRDGEPVVLDVDADLTTFTERAFGGGRGPGGPGGPGDRGGWPGEHTEVTGAELTEVTDAVEAHDGSITVESVREDPDGSYDVHGTRDGEPVVLDVSADLATFTERTLDGDRGPGGHGPFGARGEPGAGTPS